MDGGGKRLTLSLDVPHRPRTRRALSFSEAMLARDDEDDDDKNEEQCMRKSSSAASLRRSASARSAHRPLTRKISFPIEEVFQSSVIEGDNEELWRVLKQHSSKLDLNKSNHMGLTPLHHAVLNDNLDAVKMLLMYGCDVNSADTHGFTALHAASACGYVCAASLIILFGADVFSKTEEGDTPVDVAKDLNTAQVLQDEMVTQLHGQYEQQSEHWSCQLRDAFILLTKALWAAFMALCLFLWDHVKKYQ